MFNWVTNALGELLDSVLGAVMVAVNVLLYLINTWIYKMITPLYDIFGTLSNTRIIDVDVIEILTDRISVILGVVMFFIVTISFIQMLLEPDNLTDKEKGAGNIIKKIIIVIVLLGTGPFVFNIFYKVQNVVLESHIISKFLLPYEVDTEQFGGVLTSELFTAFYHLNSDVEEKLRTDSNIKDFEQSEMAVQNGNCANVVSNLKKDIIKNNSFDIGLQCMNVSINIDGEKFDYIDYNPIVMTLCGVFAVYILFIYCITVGVRTVQLAFLEVISPMAFISYLSPKKETMFEKWWKIYFATYLDVFIRVMIINFVVFLISIIFSSDQGWTFFDTLGGDTLLVKVIMVLALLNFAKKAPDLLKDIFPTGAAKLGYGTGMPAGVGALLGGLAGGAIGALGAASRGWGNTREAYGLLKKGWKNKDLEGKSFREKLQANKDNLKGVGKAAFGNTIRRLPAAVGTGALGIARGGYSARNAKGLDGLKIGQQAQAKANLATAQRKASGLSNKEYLADKARGIFGIQTGYDTVDKELSTMTSVMSSYENNPVLKKMASTTDDTLNKVNMLTSEANLEYNTKLAMFTEHNNNALRIQELHELKNNSDISKSEKEKIDEEFKALVSRNAELISEGPLKDPSQLAIERDNKIEAANKLYKEQKKMEDDMKDATYMIAKANVEAKKAGKEESIEETTLRIKTILEEKFKDSIVIKEDGKASFGLFDVMVTEANKATMENASGVLGSEFVKLQTFKDANSYRWAKDAEKISISNRKSSE